jgi:signal transduction histidine kinase
MEALKYAKATTIAVSLIKTSDGELQLAIKDNGVGMDIETVDQDKHFGLLGMRERVQALYGSFSIEAAPNQGTVISIHIPKRIAS